MKVNFLKIFIVVLFGTMEIVQIQAQEIVGKSLSCDTVCTIQINSFTDIPEEIDGCACAFSVSREELKKRLYIFVNDFASLAFVKVDGELKRFELQSYNEDNHTYYYFCKEDIMEVKIFNKITCEDESVLIEGIITIMTKNGIIKQKFIGTCDC
ncbi:MAG: hypothetical protein IKS33_09610 [Bacteroidales bacterium]|nr:hypothetical protein [Bacteroidales bacterium]